MFNPVHYRRMFGIIPLIFLCLWVSSSVAADFPTRPVTLFCGYGPGGPGDVQARAIASALEPLLGQPVVVQNKAGATGSVMLALLKNSKPDGYTIGLTPASIAVSPYFQEVQYDVTKDFSYLAAMNTYMEVFSVRTDAPWKTLKDLVEYARKNPNQLKFGTSGMTGSTALMTRYVGKEAGVQWTLVPFDSDAAIVTSLLGNNIHVGVDNGSQIPHVKAGTLRMIGVATPERMKEWPDLPTYKEQGYDFVTLTISGIVGPRGIPEEIEQKLMKALSDARKAPVFVDAMKTQNMIIRNEVGDAYKAQVLDIYKKVAEYKDIK
jgi:tripartite-type tricarboxylate transporter receptor subunit TctC